MDVRFGNLTSLSAAEEHDESCPFLRKRCAGDRSAQVAEMPCPCSPGRRGFAQWRLCPDGSLGVDSEWIQGGAELWSAAGAGGGRMDRGGGPAGAGAAAPRWGLVGRFSRSHP